ncbi:hypothetical protein [Eubacterium sp. 1001713B170207_170306_E7]|uniref:hypothetical protein n=1 Tax=Eubacterium sp. 1001713B170207_170306_E7 TaxID=2787097 RepID=UPI00189AFF59|nr:hypothetical protein [Eubacterium sp. 1001713B170207_170306_E7]
MEKIINENNQTFILEIKSTRNNTWQGTILWVQTQQKVAFRSALEAIKILDSALTSQKNVEADGTVLSFSV